MISTILRQTSVNILSRKQPGYQRFLHQHIDFNEQLIGIKGARGCGKTTLLLQHAHNSQRELQRVFEIGGACRCYIHLLVIKLTSSKSPSTFSINKHRPHPRQISHSSRILKPIGENLRSREQVQARSG